MVKVKEWAQFDNSRFAHTLQPPVTRPERLPVLFVF